MSLPDLAIILARWQDMLRLQQFDISARYVKPSETDGDIAAIDIYWAHMRAEIKILDPAFAAPGDALNNDVEVSVVHELLHLFVERDWKPEPDSTAFQDKEAFIDRQAKLLVSLYRAGRKK